MTLENRIEKLESESSIRQLKARYLNACDRKDAEAMKACFTPDAAIDFPPLGEFNLDSLVDIFTQMAVNTPITCLLYTSPSPRDLSTSRMPSSA